MNNDQSSSEASASFGGDYVYYDNSETKWEKVYAYWWEKSFAETKNKITGETYGEAWPGLPMEKVGDTDIYRIVIPVGADNIVFNTGVPDEEIKNGVQSLILMYIQQKLYSSDELYGLIICIHFIFLLCISRSNAASPRLTSTIAIHDIYQNPPVLN